MSRFAVRAAAASAAALIAACTVQPSKQAEAPPAAPAPQPERARACTPAQAGSALIGTWYATSTQAGVKGRLHTLMVLQQDGSMRLTNRVSSGREIRSELRESGCWEATGNTLATRVTQSNGEAVDGEQAIYRNEFQVEKVDARQLVYRELRTGGTRLTAKRMQDGYRLP